MHWLTDHHNVEFYSQMNRISPPQKTQYICSLNKQSYINLNKRDVMYISRITNPYLSNFCDPTPGGKTIRHKHQKSSYL